MRKEAFINLSKNNHLNSTEKEKSSRRAGLALTALSPCSPAEHRPCHRTPTFNKATLKGRSKSKTSPTSCPNSGGSKLISSLTNCHLSLISSLLPTQDQTDSLFSDGIHPRTKPCFLNPPEKSPNSSYKYKSLQKSYSEMPHNSQQCVVFPVVTSPKSVCPTAGVVPMACYHHLSRRVRSFAA